MFCPNEITGNPEPSRLPVIIVHGKMVYCRAMPIKLFVSRRSTDLIFCQIEKKFNVDTKQAKYSIEYKYEVSSCVLNLHNFVSLRATGTKHFIGSLNFKWNRC